MNATIQVRFEDGTIVMGRVSRSPKEYATITIKVHGSFLMVKASWDAVDYCINENLPLSL